MRAGADALKSLRALAPLAEVESILSDSRAAKEYESQMAQLLEGGGTTGGMGLDPEQEGQVEEELEALVAAEEAKEAREETAGLPEVPRSEAKVEKKEETAAAAAVEELPSVPTGVVVSAAGKEEEGKEKGEEAKEEERVPVLAG